MMVIMTMMIVITLIFTEYHHHLDHCQHCFWSSGSRQVGVVGSGAVVSLGHTPHFLYTASCCCNKSVQMLYQIQIQIRTPMQIQKLVKKYRYSVVSSSGHTLHFLSSLLSHDCANAISNTDTDTDVNTDKDTDANTDTGKMQMHDYPLFTSVHYLWCARCTPQHALALSSIHCKYYNIRLMSPLLEASAGICHKIV